MSNNGLYIRDEGSGPPVLLIHGWSCPGVFFDQQVAALSGVARCIVPDLPGHGRTGDNLSLTIESAAEALYAYITEQDLNNLVLCGWSMGALVAYSMLERFGAARVSDVVSIDMSPKVLNAPDWSNGTLSGLNETSNIHVLEGIVPDWPKLPNLIAQRLFTFEKPVAPDLLEFARSEICKADPALLRPMWESLTQQDFRQFLKSMPVPLHLVVGLRSQLYGDGLHKWHRENVEQCRIHQFEDAGHSPHLEEPSRFTMLLRGLLGT